ncbi:Cex1 protein [Saccharomycopsis crataegensis]|uniref:Cex1 protein n=1 Tax=Saccharomycopsis crataegensis TaxID=43959 RepID=A0AAV5QY32_9ASCO|nr:Cex1 protein [Saccharomycopsis crataegensis]
MNFLTKTLGSFTSGYNLPFTIGEPIESPNSIWSLYQGTSKSDSTNTCTVFEFDLRDPSKKYYVALARNAIKKLKGTRIPGVLKVYDTSETDSMLHIFCEPVVPLPVYLDQNDQLSDDAVMLGVYVIAQTLKYLNVEGSAIHGGLDISNVYVTESGEWRLGGFELMTSTKSDPDQPLYRLSAASPIFQNIVPPEVSTKGVDSVKSHPYKLDSYKLGGLIWCLFNKVSDTRSINSSSDFLKVSKLPKFLQPAYKKLMQNSPTARISTEQFLVQGEKSQIFNSGLIRCYRDLAELSLKSNYEKLEFMKSLEQLKPVAPPGFLEYKIIPELANLFSISLSNQQPQDMNHSATCLYYILSFSEKLKDTVFSKIVAPIIIQAFSLPDRTIRVTLLTSLPQFAPRLSKSEISDKIFGPLLTGFSDTNITIREETLKAVLPIASKLTDRQLSNELLRYLAKLQNDESEIIRTNVVVCLCKLAQHLNSSARAGVLITAYNKAIKDKFPPARKAAIMSFGQNIEIFTPEICCSRVLSSIAPCLLDSSGTVRKLAREVFENYMEKINEEADRLPSKDDVDEFGHPMNEEGFMISSSGSSRPNGGSSNFGSSSTDSFGTETAAAAAAEAAGPGITGSLSGFGYNLAMGAISKMSGVGGQLETDMTLTPTDSRASTPQPTNNFGMSNENNSSSSFVNSYSSKPATRKLSTVAKTSSGWGTHEDFDLDEENGDGADDGWGFGMENDSNEVEVANDRLANLSMKKSTSSNSKASSIGTKTTTSSRKISSNSIQRKPTTGAKKSGLKLGNGVGGGNKLNLRVDMDEDDGWGNGW